MSLIKSLEKKFRWYFPKRINNAANFLAVLRDKKGLEIGGPSPSLSHRGFLPAYDVLRELDGCNFGNETVWEGKLHEGHNYQWDKNLGKQFIADGSELPFIKTGSYDVVLSCHSIEHFANPIKAINEWKRILVEEGHLLLVVPHKDKTFDKDRPVTKLSHLIDDFENGILENDDTHFEEVIQLHDITLDYGVNSKDELSARTYKNIENRCVHHHVFNTPLVVQLADYLNMQILQLEHFNPFNIVVLLKKTNLPDNREFRDKNNSLFQKFPSDNLW